MAFYEITGYAMNDEGRKTDEIISLPMIANTEDQALKAAESLKLFATESKKKVRIISAAEYDKYIDGLARNFRPSNYE